MPKKDVLLGQWHSICTGLNWNFIQKIVKYRSWCSRAAVCLVRCPTPTAMDAQFHLKRQPQSQPHLRTVAPFFFQHCLKAFLGTGDLTPCLQESCTPHLRYANRGLPQSLPGDRMAGKIPFQNGGSQLKEKMSHCTTLGRIRGSSRKSTAVSSIFFLPARPCTALEGLRWYWRCLCCHLGVRGL